MRTTPLLHRSARAAAAGLALLAAGTAGAFDLAIADPSFALAVPGLPAIRVAEQPRGSATGRRVLGGRDATFAVDVALQRQAAEPSPRVCAGLFLRSLVVQPGMPNRDSIYRAPLDENTFLVIYLLGDAPQQALHAHIFSSAGSTHCVDAHFSRAATPGEDIDAWRVSFSTARAKPAAK